MILTDLPTFNQKRLKKQDTLSIARSVYKHLARMASMGYVRGAVVEGDRALVVVTTQGRRFEIAVREISCDEEIDQANAFSAARKVIDPKNLPPVNCPPRDPDMQAFANEVAKVRGAPIHLPDHAPREAVVTGKAARIFAHREPLDAVIDGEYVYRNYAVNYDGRTWDDLSKGERLSWDDKARRLVEQSAEAKPQQWTDRQPAAEPKAPEPVTGRDLYLTMIDNSGVHCNRFPGWDELDAAAQADWNRKAQN